VGWVVGLGRGGRAGGGCHGGDGSAANAWVKASVFD